MSLGFAYESQIPFQTRRRPESKKNAISENFMYRLVDKNWGVLQ